VHLPVPEQKCNVQQGLERKSTTTASIDGIML